VPCAKKNRVDIRSRIIDELHVLALHTRRKAIQQAYFTGYPVQNQLVNILSPIIQ